MNMSSVCSTKCDHQNHCHCQSSSLDQLTQSKITKMLPTSPPPPPSPPKSPQLRKSLRLSSRLLPPPPPPPIPSSLSIKTMEFHRSTLLKETNPQEQIVTICERFIPTFMQFKKNKSMALLSIYNHCDPVIQTGPTCGLVALIMCLKLVNQNLDIDLPTILDLARKYGFTKFGEMFSASNMATFIKKEFSLKIKLKYDLDRSMLDVVKHICQGLPVLVPYDADSNYEPCLKFGARAHWAMICGFVIINPLDKCIISTTATTKNQTQIQFEKIIDLNEEIRLFQIVSPNVSNWKKSFDYIKRYLSLDKLFVLARQGKSRHIQLWNFHKLCQSNKNLNFVNSKIFHDPERLEMVFPEDGNLTESLSNQFILIY